MALNLYYNLRISKCMYFCPYLLPNYSVHILKLLKFYNSKHLSLSCDNIFCSGDFYEVKGFCKVNYCIQGIKSFSVHIDIVAFYRYIKLPLYLFLGILRGKRRSLIPISGWSLNVKITYIVRVEFKDL
ncbi:uncharacterized protein LOC132068829 isoform X1 [Lycium ferocissimum]|uniref:uncharacterized protein LOC132068829 isoform X1 n=1 Tax=Lycium ferocissimum TaxID=112874 RepID=UPI0028164163|nr:uncharacterized protein LOC132068829 isoform X1 [Lycium ferocissimum]